MSDHTNPTARPFPVARRLIVPAPLRRAAAAFALGATTLLGSCTPNATRVPLTAAGLQYRAGAAREASEPLRAIAFGSCNRTDLPQPLWEPINATAPDLWIWLGDNIYADSDDMSVHRAKYEAQLRITGYVQLLETTPIIGTWDDHDFGVNNGGRDNPFKARAQSEMLDFLGEPPDSERRGQEGVYTSYTYGDVPHQTKVILLDTRYHRGDPGPESDVLGVEQWAWLEAELTGSDAQLHVIGGGFQFLPVDHQYEKWANFPRARSRLIEVIGRSGAPGVILLSGDRHISEIMRIEEDALRYPLYEITSSGMTHSWANNPGEANRFRVGELYTQLSFGVLEVDWEVGTVSMQLRAQDGSVAVEEVVDMATLRTP